jgi:hypothetical protein
MNGTLLTGIILVIGMVVLVSYVVGVYNMLVRLANNIDKAWSNIDVILKQRHDELPKLVQVCNSYMTHERETLESVTKARTAYSAGLNIDDKAQAENQIAGALGKLFAVAEQYPDLKANQEFQPSSSASRHWKAPLPIGVSSIMTRSTCTISPSSRFLRFGWRRRSDTKQSHC